MLASCSVLWSYLLSKWYSPCLLLYIAELVTYHVRTSVQECAHSTRSRQSGADSAARLWSSSLRKTFNTPSPSSTQLPHRRPSRGSLFAPSHDSSSSTTGCPPRMNNFSLGVKLCLLALPVIENHPYVWVLYIYMMETNLARRDRIRVHSLGFLYSIIGLAPWFIEGGYLHALSHFAWFLFVSSCTIVN